MSAKTKRTVSGRRFVAPPFPEPDRDDIAQCATSLWEEEGRPQGRDLDLWLLAEMRLRQGCRADAGAGRDKRPRCSGRPAFTWSEPDGVVA